MNNVKSYILIALTYFFIAAFFGILLRLLAITDLEATYRFIVHTHSHIALLGWVYVAITTIIYHIGIDQKEKKKYTILFWNTQLTIIGMLFTFPFIGYALYSIIFSTLFLICSYWFYSFFKRNHTFNTKSISYKFIATSLLFMIISSIGPWALGIIMNSLGASSPWYKNAIYFYLHFQYNGWFIFALFGVFYFILEKEKMLFSEKLATLFYKLMLVSCVLTLCLSFLWTEPSISIYLIACVGAIIQLIAFFVFYKQLQVVKNKIKKLYNSHVYFLLKFVFVLFFIKISLQTLTGIPYFSELATYILDFVIGYLHLTFLGIVSIMILIFLSYLKLITLPKTWLLIYILGFIFSEALIFYKGSVAWMQLPFIDNYYFYLVLCSALMPIGILGVFFKTITNSTQPKSL